MTIAEAKEPRDAGTMAERDIQEWLKIRAPYLHLQDVQMSPGGRFALAVSGSSGNVTAILIRLSDMACVPVECGGTFDDYLSVRSQRNGSLVSWSTAGCLVGAGKGGLYQLEAGK